MKSATLKMMAIIMFCSTGNAFIKLNNFTEVKITTKKQKIECEKIYEVEKQFASLVNEQTFILNRLSTETLNNNDPEKLKLLKLLDENRRKQMQVKLKENSLKDSMIEIKVDLNYNGLSKFLLERSLSAPLSSSGQLKSRLSHVRSPVNFIEGYYFSNSEPNQMLVSFEHDKISLNIPQGQYCFSDEVNLGAAISFDVEHTFPSETIVLTHHIGFDLTKAKTEQIALDDNYSRKLVFENAIEPIMSEIFSLSNFFLINDQFIYDLTREGSKKKVVTQELKCQRKPMKTKDDLLHPKFEYLKVNVVNYIPGLDNLRSSLKLAKDKLHAQRQIENSELLAMLKQYGRYKVYENGLIGVPVQGSENAMNAIEVIFGKDKQGVFIERILVNSEVIFAVINEPLGNNFPGNYLEPEECIMPKPLPRICLDFLNNCPDNNLPASIN